ARVEMFADELLGAGLEAVAVAAAFVGALERCGMEESGALPFELGEAVRRVIDGARSRAAMEECCEGDEAREGAAVLGAVCRVCRGEEPFGWAVDVLEDGRLGRPVWVSLQVVDDALARVPLELSGELGFRPRLDSEKSSQTGREHQLVMVGKLALFWVEEGRVRCGMSERYGPRWARVVRFARRRGYPIHVGFQGAAIGEERLGSILEVIEER
ncbi:MAG: hypothetical protein ACOCV2_14085, partial [Persicimonas sp.]